MNNINHDLEEYRAQLMKKNEEAIQTTLPVFLNIKLEEIRKIYSNLEKISDAKIKDSSNYKQLKNHAKIIMEKINERIMNYHNKSVSNNTSPSVVMQATAIPTVDSIKREMDKCKKANEEIKKLVHGMQLDNNYLKTKRTTVEVNDEHISHLAAFQKKLIESKSFITVFEDTTKELLKYGKSKDMQFQSQYATYSTWLNARRKEINDYESYYKEHLSFFCNELKTHIDDYKNKVHTSEIPQKAELLKLFYNTFHTDIEKYQQDNNFLERIKESGILSSPSGFQTQEDNDTLPESSSINREISSEYQWDTKNDALEKIAEMVMEKSFIESFTDNRIESKPEDSIKNDDNKRDQEIFEKKWAELEGKIGDKIRDELRKEIKDNNSQEKWAGELSKLQQQVNSLEKKLKSVSDSFEKLEAEQSDIRDKYVNADLLNNKMKEQNTLRKELIDNQNYEMKKISDEQQEIKKKLNQLEELEVTLKSKKENLKLLREMMLEDIFSSSLLSAVFKSYLEDMKSNSGKHFQFYRELERIRNVRKLVEKMMADIEKVLNSQNSPNNSDIKTLLKSINCRFQSFLESLNHFETKQTISSPHEFVSFKDYFGKALEKKMNKQAEGDNAESVKAKICKDFTLEIQNKLSEYKLPPDYHYDFADMLKETLPDLHDEFSRLQKENMKEEDVVSRGSIDSISLNYDAFLEELGLEKIEMPDDGLWDKRFYLPDLTSWESDDKVENVIITGILSPGLFIKVRMDSVWKQILITKAWVQVRGPDIYKQFVK